MTRMFSETRKFTILLLEFWNLLTFVLFSSQSLANRLSIVWARKGLREVGI